MTKHLQTPTVASSKPDLKSFSEISTSLASSLSSVDVSYNCCCIYFQKTQNISSFIGISICSYKRNKYIGEYEKYFWTTVFNFGVYLHFVSDGITSPHHWLFSPAVCLNWDIAWNIANHMPQICWFMRCKHTNWETLTESC